MKKRVYGRKFSRNRNSRKALFRSLIRALVHYGKVTTTKAKAKAIQGQIDKYINLAKTGEVSKRRRLYAALGNDRESTDLIDQIAKSLIKERKGGYTRIVQLPARRGDRAEMARIEWVEDVTVGSKSRTNNRGGSGKKAEKVSKVAKGK